MVEKTAELFCVERNGDFLVLGVHDKWRLTAKAHFARTLLERWGHYGFFANSEVPAAEKMILLSPEDMVSRAVTTTDLFFEACEKRGWILETPANCADR